MKLHLHPFPYLLVLFSLVVSGSAPRSTDPSQPSPANPILFVTQTPNPSEWMTTSLTFGNHLGGLNNAVRGGDLYIRYPDGTLKNLTEAAGYGRTGFQGPDGIAVRDPSVHWDGTKAIFSMVIGAPEQQYQYQSYYWQLYEITGLGPTDTPVITKVPNQPVDFNNVSPIYGSDDRIIFTSDLPRAGAAATHLYPQRDEYESTETVTGMWSLDPSTGDLFMINHAPSGSFRPFLDSFGRLLSTRWDHLQRDQQNQTWNAYNWSGEAPGDAPTGSNEEIFPEPRIHQTGSNINGHRIEIFMPWQNNEDGTEEEFLNHLGRHELTSYMNHTFTDDPALEEFLGTGYNPNRVENVFQIKESPTVPGRYLAVSAPTFGHHASGRLFSLDAPPDKNPDSVQVVWLTDEVANAGHFRHPLPLSDGSLIASHTSYTGTLTNLGSQAFPRSPFRFRLRTLVDQNGTWTPDAYLTSGIYKTVSYWDPDFLITYVDTVAMWEFDPVEVVARPRPTRRTAVLDTPEQQIFDEEGIDAEAVRTFLRDQGLALVVSRNVTTRDQADKLQPYNLRVAGTTTQAVGNNGTLYDISHMQLYQGDLIRSYTIRPDGRRVLAQLMHDDGGNNPDTGVSGRVAIAEDGSVAAIVPARRAVTWSLLDPVGEAVVRERYWISFQAGEIRACGGCHGVNTEDQAGNPAATNPPEALRTLLQSVFQPTVTLDADLFLQGAFNVDSLRADLNTTMLLPAHQPYDVEDWNYAGAETVSETDLAPTNGYPDFFEARPEIVDWVLLGLRTAPEGPTLARRAALLRSDGSVVDIDGESPVTFSDVAPGSYYVVADHRNHLAAMSAGPVDFSSGAAAYDFTTGLAYGPDPLADLGGGRYGLWAGDANADGKVQYIGAERDQLIILQILGLDNLAGSMAGYAPGDLNMDGAVEYIGADRDQLTITNSLGLNNLAGTRTTPVPE